MSPEIIGLNGKPLQPKTLHDLPEPHGKITSNAAQEVLVVLTRTTRAPNRCISKGQVIEAAEKAIALNVILERRAQILKLYIGEFLAQASELPDDDAVASTVTILCKEMLKVLQGEK